MDPIKLHYYNHHFGVHPRHVRRGRVRYYDLTIVLGGTLYYVGSGAALENVELKAGDFFLIRPGEYRQRLDSEPIAEYVSFNFLTDMDLSSVPNVSTDAVTAEIRMLLNACDGFLNTEGAFDKIGYLLGALLLTIRDTVSNAHMHPLALEIKNHLLKHYTERVTLESIAEQFHFSVSYCNNVFKRGTGQTIVDFVIGERMRKAKELLVYTDFTLPEVALKVGYEDYNYFSRLFKKHVRATPTQYRARCAGK